MAGGIIVLRNPGTEAKGLESYLRMMIPKSQARCFGMAIADKGKLQINHVNRQPDPEDVIKAIEAVKQCPILMHFGMYPQTYSEHDVQPFLLLCKDDDIEQPMLCAALSGEFNGNSGSSHLDVWDTAYDYLEPKLNGTFALLDQDLNKLIQSIKNKGFDADLAAQIKSTGTIAFLAASGEAWNVMKNIKVAKDATGWWTNNHLGWKEEDQVAKDNASERTPAAQASPKKGGFRESLGALRGSTATTAPAQPAPAPLPAQPPAATPKPAPTEGPTASEIPEKVWREGIKAVRRWCQAACGYTPKEIVEEDNINKLTRKNFLVITKTDRDIWKAEHPEIKPQKPTSVVHKTPEPTVAEPAKKLSVAEKIAAKRAAAQATEQPAEPTPEAKPAEEPGQSTQPGTREFVPVPPPSERDGIEVLLIEAMEGTKIPHPKDVKETKFSSFSECFGLSSLSEIKLTKEMAYQLVQDYPVSAAMLILQYQAEHEQPAAEEAAPAKTSKVA